MPNKECYDEVVSLLEKYSASDIVSSLMFYYKILAKSYINSTNEEDTIRMFVANDLYKLFRDTMINISEVYKKRVVAHLDEIQPLFDRTLRLIRKNNEHKLE
jgi:hypothetical protein